MKQITTLRKGNQMGSLVATIKKPTVEDLQLKEGDVVQITIDKATFKNESKS